MSPDDLRRACLKRPGAGEEFPFGPETSVFKVEGKMFALSALGSPALRVSLKCEPALAEQLRDAHPEIVPGYHLNKRLSDRAGHPRLRRLRAEGRADPGGRGP